METIAEVHMQATKFQLRKIPDTVERRYRDNATSKVLTDKLED